MTAPKQEPGNAVATRQANAVTQANAGDGSGGTLERYEKFGKLNAPARAEMTRARVVREVADLVGLTEWGSKLGPAGQVAIAKWCIRRDVDPLTELDNVGGPYLNSEYWIRKLGELRVRGVVRDVKQFSVAFDARLETLAKDQNAPDDVRERAKVEHYRRMELRAQYGVPEAATGACVTLIYLIAGGEPIAGCKWGGGGTSVKQPRSGGASAPNPIVENNPTLSVESQSIRRAMRQLALSVPAVLPEFDDMTGELKDLANASPPKASLASGPTETRDGDKAYRAFRVQPGLSVVVEDREPVAEADSEPMPVLDPNRAPTTSTEPIYEPDDEDEDQRQLRLDAERFTE